MNVKIENLTKVFPGRDRKSAGVTAVDNFTLDIPDGKLVCLLGPSGCGKSTLLYMICGLESPTSGKLYFGENDVTDVPPEKRGVGLVFQNYALYPHLTVRQIIRFPLENLKGDARLTNEEMDRRALEAAKLVQIENLMDRKPGQMSGGQQQRVAIARALVKMPNVLLMDEPLSNLDARLRLQTREEIRRIQRETGITTIFVTHDQEEAMSISDMIIVMKEGILNQIGKPQDVYDDPINLFVACFLGTPKINVFEGFVRNGGLYIGGDNKSEKVLDIKGVEDKPVWVGVRPEGFEVAKDGRLSCELVGVDVMGRDISVVCKNHADSEVIRAIISAETEVDREAKTVKFNLKPHKTFIFDKETEERIRFT